MPELQFLPGLLEAKQVTQKCIADIEHGDIEPFCRAAFRLHDRIAVGGPRINATRWQTTSVRVRLFSCSTRREEVVRIVSLERVTVSRIPCDGERRIHGCDDCRHSSYRCKFRGLETAEVLSHPTDIIFRNVLLEPSRRVRSRNTAGTSPPSTSSSNVAPPPP